MTIALVSKPGLTPASAYYVPKDWDQSWMRRFIGDQLKFADVRNAVGNNGITVSGNLSSGYAQIGLTPPVVITETATSGITVLQLKNDGVHDAEMVISTSTAGDAYYRATDFGGVNWSWGNQRSTNNFVIAQGVGLSANQRFVIETSGNVIIPAPGSGSALTVTGPGAGVPAIAVTLPTSGVAPSFFSQSAQIALAMNSAGSNWGLIQNTSSNRWALATATALNALGTEVLAWLASGSVIINTPSGVNTALTVNGANNAYTFAVNGGTTAGQSYGTLITAGTNASDLALNIRNAAANASLFLVYGDGHVTFPSISTTASAANAFLDSANGNNLLRSTSSIRYKTDVQLIEGGSIDAILKLRPIHYRSRAKADDQTIRHLGLIAEEVADVEPRLVHFSPYAGKMRPESVQYERLTVLLLAYIQRLHRQLSAAGILLQPTKGEI